MRELIHRALRLAGLRLVRTRNYFEEHGLITLHKPRFHEDAAFEAAYARAVRANAGHDPDLRWRVHVALWAASAAANLSGEFVECGVNAGFISSAILHAIDLRRPFFLVDTFAGPVLSQFSAEEVQHGRRAIAETALAAGAYVADIERIRNNFAEWPNAIVVQGAVSEVLPRVATNQIAFLHLDMNCAAPEIAALEHFWPRMCAGGFILLDDYGFVGHETQGQAIDLFAHAAGVSVLGLPTGQGVLVKPPATRDAR
jgi:hypothetical protein